ncbi:T-complex protein 1 subunit epsilon [Venturia nashicola]|nr:T-complex protein 1 subunit epsilon [Venturia nashicola]
MDELPTAVATELLFRDVYRILEDVQGSAERLEPFAESIAICHWTIQNLERLLRVQAQTHNPNLPKHVLELSRILERFIASCSALATSMEPPISSTELQIGCMCRVQRRTKKRNPIRELQDDFWDHQNMLSLVLSNAIYMTALDMQKSRQSPDPALASILRHSQKRHTIYERDQKNQEGKAHRPNDSRVELLEWEFCVRRYFEYVDAEQQRAAEALQSRQSCAGPLVRCGSESTLASAAAHRRPGCRTTTSTSSYSYDSYRTGEALSSETRMKRLSADGDPYNAIYTRSRRNSTASNVSATNSESRRNSFANLNEGSPVLSPTAIGSLHSTATVPVEAYYSTEEIPNHSCATVGDNLQQAWIDIRNATRDMLPNEARAYTQGRLDGLDPSLTVQLHVMGDISSQPKSLTAQISPRSSKEKSALQSSLPNNPLSLNSSSEEVPPLDLYQRRSQLLRVARPGTTKSSVSRANRANSLPLHTQRRLSCRPSKTRVSSLRADHLRQLSPIVERPMTPASKKSKNGSIRSLKSILSFKKEKIPPVPEIPYIKLESRKPSDSSLSDSSTLRGSTPDNTPRIVELVDSPPSFTMKAIDRRAMQKSSLKQASNLSSKPPPIRPDQFPVEVMDEPLEYTNNIIKRLSRFFSASRKETSLHDRLSSKSSPHPIDCMRSAESLAHKVSLDAMSRKNGSRSTICLVAIQEVPDQPFQVWLNALPYIEGRPATPTPRA